MTKYHGFPRGRKHPMKVFAFVAGSAFVGSYIAIVFLAMLTQ